MKPVYYIAIFLVICVSCSSNNNQQPIDYAYAINDNFDIIDSNKDSYVTLQEAQAVLPGLDKDKFLLMDYDGDQQLSLSEVNQFIEENKTCGSTLRRGISCTSQRIENWITDFITLLFSLALLWYLPVPKITK
ncbi:MAG: hypothetical protein N3G21_02185 [Candidatus Hydrogenedentes bacterium]|nr:hypothetical protein [Candidatus Hydrogenedentota bacterium]